VVSYEVLEQESGLATMQIYGERVLWGSASMELGELFVEIHLIQNAHGGCVKDDDVEHRWRVKKKIVAESVSLC
jgi:hypothetical protein